ncbi:MAG: competence protein TfoX [Phycisphaera sp.]|nr:competence protein TfoX [Phycisphaera sp.]
MFGGHGLYSDGVFFAIIHADTLYLKTDDASRAAFVERDCEPFRPTDKITLRTYYETPSDVLEHVETLTAWARRAVEAKRDEDDANDPGRAKPTKTPRRHTRRRRG